MAFVPKLFPGKLKLQEAAQQFFTVELPDNVSLEDALKPEFWVNVIERIQPFAELNVFPCDGSWYAKLLVVHVEGKDISFQVLGQWDLEAKLGNVEISPDYSVKRAGPIEKFRVVRNSDGVVMKTGLQTKALAIKYITDNLKAA